MPPKIKITFWISLGLTAGVLIGFFFGENHINSSILEPRIQKIRAISTDYKLIEPLLAVDLSNINYFPEYKNLDVSLNQIVDGYKSQNDLNNISVYFRNLENGTWLGVNENDQYDPGSLFKVPIMIHYLKQADGDPSILQKKLKFDNPANQSAPQDIPPAQKIVFGQEYTISELINYMIVYSDNSAANLLAEHIYVNRVDPYTQIMADLGLSGSANHISAKTYSLFFRIIYNATYLSPDSSEKAMEILSKTDFNKGLVAGVPLGTTVAHKFGEYGKYDLQGSLVEELHDCGVVYAPKHTYALCVMTKGNDVSNQENIIKEISQLIYGVMNQ